MVVTLGALLADVPHTRPVPITGLASDPELVERLVAEPLELRGPHRDRRRSSTTPAGAARPTSRSLWAAVPHYVAAVPNPKAALALLRRLEGFTGDRDRGLGARGRGERFETQVDRAVAANPEIEELVRRLEAEQRRGGLDRTEDMPSGDAIAQDFQRFLRAAHRKRRR